MTMSPDKPVNILLVGPLPPPLGGVTILFQQLVNDISERDDVEIKVINTTRHNRSKLGDGLAFIRICLQILWLTPKVNVVSLHAAAGGFLLLGPVVWFLSRVFRKKSVLRRFAGRSDLQYEQLANGLKWFVRNTTLKMDLLLFETNYLVQYFKDITTQPVRWFSNNRALPDDSENIDLTQPSSGARRFVFISQVRACKGIHQICAAVSRIVENIQIDVYGPLFDAITEHDFTQSTVRYCGVLSPELVISTLKKYDVLLIPTYCPTEGYPGIILESYCAGVPVISTRLNAIPEIVDQDSGILIEPKNVDELVSAMLRLIHSPEELAWLKQGARQKAYEFSSEVWSNKFVELVKELCA